MKHGFPTASCVARLSERAGATRRFRGKTDKGEDINRSLGVDPGASWRADFSRNGCRRRQLPSFRDFASTRLALAEDPNMMPTRVEFPTAARGCVRIERRTRAAVENFCTAVQHLT